MCDSPLLFAAYHVLHRLLVPRHPPDALSNLTFVSVSLNCLFLSGKNVLSLLSFSIVFRNSHSYFLKLEYIVVIVHLVN